MICFPSPSQQRTIMLDNTPYEPLNMRDITIQIPVPVAQKMAETYDGTLEDATLAGLRLIHGLGTPSYTTLQNLAKQLGTSVPKTLRTAINLLETESARMALIRQPGRPKINEARDAEIFKRVSKGGTYAEVASAMGLSLVRVGQIMAQQRATRGIAGQRRRATLPIADVMLSPADLEARRQFRDRTSHADMFFEMGAGMSAAEAAAKYDVPEDQARAGYEAYRAALPEGERSNKGAKATAVFAGLHALEEPKQPEVLSLEVSAETPPAPTTPTTPAKPRYVMPGLKPRNTEPDDGLTAVQRNVFDPEFGF
jgi:transcriptional regulator with XRE-family HTH domain